MRTSQTMVCGVFAVLLLVCAGAGVFAQEKKPEAAEEAAAPGEKKNAITLDAIPLFRGLIASDSDSDTFFFCLALAYERLVAPHFTIGAEIDLFSGKVSDVGCTYFSLLAAGRYYPMSEYMEKFFMGANLGFSSQSIDGSTDSANGGFVGLRIGLKAGYKLLLGKAFFLEPSMAYTYEKTSAGLAGFFASTPKNLGWQGGLRLGVSF